MPIGREFVEENSSSLSSKSISARTIEDWIVSTYLPQQCSRRLSDSSRPTSSLLAFENRAVNADLAHLRGCKRVTVMDDWGPSNTHPSTKNCAILIAFARL